MRGQAVIVTVTPESGEQRKEIMLTDTVSMVITLPSPVFFQHGDSVTVYGETYWLNDLPEPEKQSSIKRKYSLLFKAAWYDLGKPLFFQYDELNELWSMSEFQIMGNADALLNLVIANANREQTGWEKGDVQDTPVKQLPFTGQETVLQALTQIAQAFELEWWIVGKKIHLAKKGVNTGYRFQYGRNKGLRGGLKRTNVDSSGAFSRLYVRGSDQNLPADYRGGQKRLMLPAPQRFIQGVRYGAHEIERPIQFDDIKPERTGYVSAVGDMYTFSDAALDFDVNAQLLPGLSAKVTFQTGNCAGYQFEIKKGGYNHATRTFTILKNQSETTLEMPSEILKPAVGDAYILSDIKMPASYIADAEQRLLIKGQQYFIENSPPKVTYSIPPDHFFFERRDIKLNLGDFVEVADGDLQIDKNIRITAYSRDLHNEYKYTSLTVSDIVKGSIINSQLAQAENIAKALSLNKVADIQRARWNWKTTAELTTLLDTVKAEMLLIMMEGGAYTTDVVVGVTAGQLTTMAGRVVHEQYTERNGIWEVAAANRDLPNNVPYYVYIKADRSNTNASIFISENKLGVESDPLFYLFPLGVISSIINDARSFTSIRGYSRVTGDTISTGRIVSNDGQNYFDLNNGAFSIGNAASGLDWGVNALGQLTIRGTVVATNADFVNLLVHNLKTATAGFKRVEIDADNNNIRLLSATNEELLTIDDDCAIIGYSIIPEPPYVTPIYGAGLMTGSVAKGAYTSVSEAGIDMTGSVISKGAGKFDKEVKALHLQTTIYSGEGAFPDAALVLATGNGHLYTTPSNGQVQTVKNRSEDTITIAAASTPGRTIMDGTNMVLSIDLVSGGRSTFQYYEAENFWVRL